MCDVKNLNDIEVFQLKECYDLAMQYEKNDSAKVVLREKSKKTNIPNNYIPVQADAIYPETDIQVVLNAIYELSLENYNAYEKTGFEYAQKINNLPSSSEKEYVLALLALRKGTSETQILDATRHISEALSYSPNDMRYIALAKVLEEIDTEGME